MGGGKRPQGKKVTCPYCGKKNIDKTYGLSVHMRVHKKVAKKEQRVL